MPISSLLASPALARAPGNHIPGSEPFVSVSHSQVEKTRRSPAACWAGAQGEVLQMLDLAATLSNLPPIRGHAPWPNHEYVRGWGVFGPPFDSGCILALRVFPENDFGPYKTVWRRDSQGDWPIYVDGPRLDTACPRYYGAACQQIRYTHIALTWTGPTTLQVTMDDPALEWTLTARSTRYLDLLNAMSAALPLASWRPRSLARVSASRDRSAWARTYGGRHAKRPHWDSDAKADVLHRRVARHPRGERPRAASPSCAESEDRRIAPASTWHARHRRSCLADP
jgi:hypothetical protein